jgi:CMP-N-acetylneuraminic acid synthetase
MIHYIIPARQGSKGLPLKNRKLLPFTLNSIPKDVMDHTIVSTDDFTIAETAKDYGARVHHRSREVSSDTASTKDLLLEIAAHYRLPPRCILPIQKELLKM